MISSGAALPVLGRLWAERDGRERQQDFDRSRRRLLVARPGDEVAL
jgi:hypothetical protein